MGKHNFNKIIFISLQLIGLFIYYITFYLWGYCRHQSLQQFNTPLKLQCFETKLSIRKDGEKKLSNNSASLSIF